MNGKNNTLLSALIAIVGVFFLGLALVAACSLLFGMVTAFLWNYALVSQGLREITMMQGAALNLLGALVTGNAFRSKSSKGKS